MGPDPKQVPRRLILFYAVVGVGAFITFLVAFRGQASGKQIALFFVIFGSITAVVVAGRLLRRRGVSLPLRVAAQGAIAVVGGILGAAISR